MARRREAEPTPVEVVVPPELARNLIEDWLDPLADAAHLYLKSCVNCTGQDMTGDVDYVVDSEVEVCAAVRRNDARNQWIRTTAEATGFAERDLNERITSWGPPKFADRPAFVATLRRAFADLGLDKN